MESSELIESEPTVLPQPSHMGRRFYRLLANELFHYGIPVFCGEHPYYHINMTRGAGVTEPFVIFETPPRTPYETLIHARQYKETGVNTVIIYRSRLLGNERLASFGFNNSDRLFHSHNTRVRLIDLSAAKQMYEQLPGDVYEDFARISSTGPNKGGVLIGGTAEKHLAILKDMALLDFAFDEMRVPPETQRGANVIAKKGGKIVAVDLRDRPAKWNGFYRLDIDNYVIVAMSHAKRV